ncbi:hypothetical protein [Tenacibaculum aiptasiae]|uniref:hypothetical protein n=1 Tax=Tenacibaculum aiptasiae TaxID=426481 RepID=UPI00232EDA74|nr:hypothetical protein [Tenacibaculum aiptasiae]
MEEPPFRCSTKKALDELEIELNLIEKNPYWESMAGYSYTAGNPNDIQEHLDYYEQLKDVDKKFTLMEMILDSLSGQDTEYDFLKYWKKTKPILIKDYLTHEYTIHYWKQMTVEFEGNNIMTPLIQELISEMNPDKKLNSRMNMNR